MQITGAELFDVILDQDEVIQKVFKPNIKKLFLSAFLITFAFWFWIPFMIIPMMLTEELSRETVLIIFVVTVAAIFLVYALELAFLSIYYNNKFYAYSNKRIIIRSGIFGVDYKSLDMSMIGAVNVYVSPLDKIMGNKTGSIIFGSMASPMVSTGSGAVNPYRFSHIESPYETYKEIKAVIDEYKRKTRNIITQ